MSGISINTNIASMLVQGNLNQSTNALNQAIERMTTGAKINHASDNAAGYSIVNNMTTKLSAYEVATDNVASGIDLVQTASSTIDLMSNHAQRLRTLSLQAQNGTYGAQSLQAINQEGSALVSEIQRLFSSAEYNGIKLFEGASTTATGRATQSAPTGRASAPTPPTATYNGFIDNPVDYTDSEVEAMTKISDVTSYTSGKTYSISSRAELEKLANDVKSGKDTTGATFVLADDIDLSGGDWTPIGYDSPRQFKGTFNGNGHTISNLIINRQEDYQGFLGCTEGATIKNLGLENVNLTGRDGVGGLVGHANNTTISNSYVTGTVSGTSYVGGLVSWSENSAISNSYVTGTVSGNNYVGGLVGVS